MSEVSIFQLEGDTPWEDLGDGVMRKIMGYDDKVMLVKVKFEVGARGQLHHHYHSQVSYVESGVFETSINGNVQVIRSGDGFYAPPNHVHGVLCIEAGTLIDVFSPPREDFL